MEAEDYPKAALKQAFRETALEMANSMEGRRLKQLLDLLVQARMFEAANATEEAFASKRGRYLEAKELRSQLFPAPKVQ